MSNKIVMDRALRIMGGLVLLILPFTQEGDVTTSSKIVGLVVGCYALITGLINYCPLAQLILQEKKSKRRKLSAADTVKISDVKGLEFFRGLTDQEIEKIISCCRLREYVKETTVLIEGKNQKVLSIIYSGQFKIVKAITDMESKIITTISDGETYGEMSFFDSKPPCVSVLSTEDSKVMEMEESDFNELLEESPQLAVKILNQLLKIMSSRIRVLNEQVAALGSWVVQGRAALRS
ncbi:MAG: cyclic nucleotide-binding domain-containing protein [Proteobacteria bacterium]|nr:cyclic nucleotide-binding domain-containing protein [Pseudomonadota bacterium]